MMRSLYSKKKHKNNNCENNSNITPIAETNCSCNNTNPPVSLCEELENQAKQYAIQANCAKEQAINLEQTAQELQQEIQCLYMQANELWNEYKELMNQYDTYMYKANCCFNQSNNNCNHTCNCNNSCNCNCSYNSNKCGYNNRPLIYCKKTGHYGN